MLWITGPWNLKQVYAADVPDTNKVNPMYNILLVAGTTVILEINTKPSFIWDSDNYITIFLH